jgi:hypothetical protein
VKKIDAIVLDLDGTLLTSEKKILARTKDILYKFAEKGTKIIIATGRTYTSLREYKIMLGFDTPVVCFNGAKVVDGRSEEIIFEYPLEEKEVRAIIDLSRKHKLHLNLYQNEVWYVENEGEEVGIYREISGLDYEYKDFDTFDDYKMTKALFVGENRKLKELEKDIEEILNSDVNKAYSKLFFLELFNNKVNKGETLKRLFDMNGINIENVIAFGDGMNDVEMLSMVGEGVVMGNAPDQVKEAVGNRICGTNDEDGIAFYLEQYL